VIRIVGDTADDRVVYPLYLTGTAEEQGRYCYLFMARDKIVSIGSLTLH